MMDSGAVIVMDHSLRNAVMGLIEEGGKSSFNWQEWCIAPPASAMFVWKMEDVLDEYTRPSEAERPLVCMDETSKQQIMEVRLPQAMKQGRVRRYDSEYRRNAECSSIDWRFTTDDARILLKKLYPSFKD